MPREVSDIKQFIEICRRKDASCTFTPNLRARAFSSLHGGPPDLGEMGGMN